MTYEELKKSAALQQIIKTIPKNSRVLDLGCGNGVLLQELVEKKSTSAFGIEIDLENINSCIAKGIAVVQADLNDGLGRFADNSFDYVILSETFQVIKNPEKLLLEMTRISKSCLINFINIGYFYDRIQLFFGGRMPKNDHLPHEWYNTPNIHLGTIYDFRDLCKNLKIEIIHEWPIDSLCKAFPHFFPNMLAKKCVFELKRR